VDWHHCYSGSHDLWVADAYSHPAKMSVPLCHRILDHLEELGLLREGDTVLDFMAGIGTTLLVAGVRGYKARGIELEERFVSLCRQNIEYVGKRIPIDATVIQGDARHLSDLLRERGVVGITSPPYAESLTGDDRPPEKQKIFRDQEIKRNRTYKGSAAGARNTYPTTPGQIGRLPDKPMKGIVSPPYQNIEIGKGLNTKPPRAGSNDQAGRSPQAPSQTDTTYSDNPDNIGNLPDRVVSITSPPFADTVAFGADNAPEWYRNKAGKLQADYGHQKLPYERRGFLMGKEALADRANTGNIGTFRDVSESYLDAMRQVYAEAYKVCDALAVVTKNPTRNGKLRRLDLDTIALLEEVGFTIRCHHRAILFEEHEQADLFGNVQKKVKGRLSFFKRLSYQKGSPVAQWEDVVVAVRDGGGLKGITVDTPTASVAGVSTPVCLNSRQQSIAPSLSLPPLGHLGLNVHLEAVLSRRRPGGLFAQILRQAPQRHAEPAASPAG
jgi:hypothetical protein